MNKLNKRLCISVAFLCAAWTVAPALAQYPEKGMRTIVPFAPGGTADVLARLMAQYMSKSMGQPIVILNMPGADARIGMATLAKAAPDGYTILFSGGAIRIVPALHKNIGYDPEKDIQPVAEVASGPYVLTVNAGLPVNNLREFVDYARKNPGKLNGAYSGSSTFMSLALFKIAAGIEILEVPYKGVPQSAMAVAAGEAHLISVEGSIFVPWVSQGKVKILAVAGPRRVPSLPDVPTSQEAGLPEFIVGATWGIYTKGGTPMPIVMRLNAEVNKAVATHDIIKQIVSLGMEPGNFNVEEFTKNYRSDLTRWKNVVSKANLPLQE